jgi:acyl-CoA thioesterase
MAALADVCARFNRSEYYGLLGLKAESDAAGTSRVRLPYSPRLLQLYGGVHGGALMSLADSALSVACATTLTEDEAIATVSISMSFLRPAGRGEVIAEGKVQKRGKRLCFASCVLTVEGDEVARAEGTIYLGPARVIDQSSPAERP